MYVCVYVLCMYPKLYWTDETIAALQQELAAERQSKEELTRTWKMANEEFMRMQMDQGQEMKEIYQQLDVAQRWVGLMLSFFLLVCLEVNWSLQFQGSWRLSKFMSSKFLGYNRVSLTGKATMHCQEMNRTVFIQHKQTVIQSIQW